LLAASGCPVGDAHGVLLSSTGPPVDEAAANINAVSAPLSSSTHRADTGCCLVDRRACAERLRD